MKAWTWFCTTAIVLLLSSFCPTIGLAAGEVDKSSAITLADDLEIVRLGSGFWQHISWFELENGPAPGNGLIFANGAGVIVVDTPWTNKQTERLIKWIKSTFDLPIKHWIVTHHHIDCLGGLEAVHAQEIPSISFVMTALLADEDQRSVPRDTFEDSLMIVMGADTIDVVYPGPAHSPDNVVVWFRSDRVLFSGCMIRSESAKSLGYTGVADLEAWPSSLANVARRFSYFEIIVPGHGSPGGAELLWNTLRLLRETRSVRRTDRPETH